MALRGGGSIAGSPVPTAKGDLFGATDMDEMHAPESRGTARWAFPNRQRSLSPAPPPPRIAQPDSNTINRFERSLQGLQRRPSISSTIASASTAAVAISRAGGDWTDSRTKNIDHANTRVGLGGRKPLPNDAGVPPSPSAAGGWVEAAAAVEKSGGAAAMGGGAAPRITTALAGANNASTRSQSGSLMSSLGGGSSVAPRESLHGPMAGSWVSLGPGSRKESTSSTDGGGGGSGGGRVVSASPSVLARMAGVRSGSTAQRQNQQRQRGGGDGGEKASAMAVAAEAAEAMAVARGHPAAGRVEERTLAVQADLDRAVASLEQHLRPLIARRVPPHSHSLRHSSPRQSSRSSSSSADKRRGRRVPASPPATSAFSSPRDSPTSPDLSSPHQFLGRKQQQQQQQQQLQRWVAAASEGSVTAPLVAAAVLLMERAWSRRQDVFSSVLKLRERAVDLAVAETTVFGGSPEGSRTKIGVATGSVAAVGIAAAANMGPVNSRSRTSSGSGSLLSPLSSSPPFHLAGRQLFAVPAGVSLGGGDVGGKHINQEMIGDQPSIESMSISESAARFSSPPLAADAQETIKDETGVTTTADAAPTIGGGLPGLSCCLDFERVLVDQESEAPPPPLLPSGGEITPYMHGDDGVAISVSPPVLPTHRYLYPDSSKKGFSESSMVAEFSFSGADQQSGGSVAAGGLTPLSSSLRETRGQQPGELMMPITAGADASSSSAAAATAPPTTDGWPAVFRDVEIVEERSEDLQDMWKTAGRALRDACEDLILEEDDSSTVQEEMAAQE